MPNFPYSPYPVSQSTPNMNVGQRILNDAYNQNLGNSNLSNINHTRTDNTQTSYNPQNLQHSQISMANMHNYQQYNVNQQPSIQVAPQNQNVLQNQRQYSFVQDMFNQNALNNNVQNSINANYSPINAQGDQINPVANTKSENQYYGQQLMQYHNSENTYQTKIETPQNIVTHSSIVNSQEHTNNPYINQQLQQHHNQQGVISPHRYTNINRQFQNLNLNDQMSLPNTGANNMAPTQFPSNTQYTNANVPSGAQNINREQIMIQPMESNVGNKLYSDPNVNWNRSNLTNIPQGLNNNDTRGSIPYLPVVNNVQMPSQGIQNMTRAQEVPPNMPLQNVTEPHLNSNQSIQPNNPVGYQDNITKLPVSPLPQNPQINNINQLHFDPYHNISQPQMSLSQPQTDPNIKAAAVSNPQSVTNHPFNPEVVGQQTYQNVVSEQPYSVGNAPVGYNQTYSSQNLNVAASKEQSNHYVNKSYPQDTSLIQVTTRPVYSAKNLPTVPNGQVSGHDIINESTSVPNMSNNVTQRNNEYVPNVFGDNSQLGKKYDAR